MKPTSRRMLITGVLALIAAFLLFHWAMSPSGKRRRQAPIPAPSPLFPAIGWKNHSHITGFAITTHGWDMQLGNLLNVHAWGSLARYNIKDGKVIGATTLYPKQDAGFACISPDGRQIAFTKRDGTIAVISSNGGQESDIANLGSDFAYIQWPGGDGGEWIYYVEAFVGESSKWLRRVNVHTRQVEVVTRFNREISSFGMSADTTRTSGRFVTRVFDGRTVVYNMAEGAGDLYHRKETEGCGISEAPDGHYFIVTTFGHDNARVHGMDGSVKGFFHVNQWAGAKSDGAINWLNMRWSTNSPKWVAIPQDGAAPGSSHPPGAMNTVLYDWVDHEQVQLTDNHAHVCDRAQGLWLDGVQPGTCTLGYYSGKAPFTVHLSSPTQQEHSVWDYGDGNRGAGAAVTHTFIRPGIYTVAARSGRQCLFARVDVEERRPPVAGSAQMLDRLHLCVTFDQRVQLKNFTAYLEGIGALRTYHLAPDGRSLVLELPAMLMAGSRLHLLGISDIAQVPNNLKNPVLPIQFLPWPTDRRGLLFVWQTQREPNARYDPVSNAVQTFPVLTHGGASTDSHGALSFDGGYAEAVEADPGIIQGCQRTHELTIEATLQPSNLTDGAGRLPARIIDFSFQVGLFNFWLGQVGGRLKFALNGFGSDTDQQKGFDLCALTPGQPNHLVISCKPNSLICFLNGQPVKQLTGVPNNFEAWRPVRLKFGGEKSWRSPWHGRLEGIAIYNRFLLAPEALAEYRIYSHFLQSRSHAPTLEVTATLIAQSHFPALSEITPYHDALVMDEYRVNRVFRGAYGPKLLRVAHRAILNDQPTPAAHLQEGTIYHLLLDPLTAHPELDQQYTSDSLPANYDLIPYTDAEEAPVAPT